MPNSIPAFKPIAGTGATSTKITNINIASASVETSHVLQTVLSGIIVRSRSNASLKIAFVNGESGSNYITIRGYSVLSLTRLALTGAVLYLQSDKANTDVEILEMFS